MRYLLTLLLLTSSLCHAQVIITYAGNGSASISGDGSPATAAGIVNSDCAIFDRSGNCYVSESVVGKVRKITPDGIIHDFAGRGIAGYSGDGGQATAAKINNVQAMAIDSLGNVFIADNYSYCIRKVDVATGIITTIAGTGVEGFNGDGIPATASELGDPLDICFDDAGNLYIADGGTDRVRKIDTHGIISTVVGTGGDSGIYVGGYVDGGLADTTPIGNPSGLCFDALGNLYIADWYSRVMKVDAAGIITTYAGNGIAGSDSDGYAATVAEVTPVKIRIARNGDLYIDEYDYCKIRKVDASTHIISTVVGVGAFGSYAGSYGGDGGPATAAQLQGPWCINFDSCGNLLIGDAHNNRVREVLYEPGCTVVDTAHSLTVNSPIGDMLNVYPDPATNELTITAPALTEGTLMVTNLLGQAVRTKPCHAITTAINVADLPPGMYFVSITGTPYTGRFIKE